MKTLISAPNPILNLSKVSPWKKPSLPVYYHPTRKLSHPFSTSMARASAKGFSSTTAANDVTKKPNRRKKNNDDDDELPNEVMYRVIGRILFSVGVPMVLGLAFLHLFDVLKEKQVWDAPRWLPYSTTLFTFGLSSLGIAYGALSSSLEAEKEGSFLGVEQLQKNWVEMWEEEKEEKKDEK